MSQRQPRAEILVRIFPASGVPVRFVVDPYYPVMVCVRDVIRAAGGQDRSRKKNFGLPDRVCRKVLLQREPGRVGPDPKSPTCMNREGLRDYLRLYQASHPHSQAFVRWASEILEFFEVSRREDDSPDEVDPPEEEFEATLLPAESEPEPDYMVVTGPGEPPGQSLVLSGEFPAPPFEGARIRVFLDGSGNPWWIAADVCRVLGVDNPTQALSRLDGDERSTLISNEGQAGKGAQSYNLISESGLYSLILTSRKPEAKRFKKWVTSEVLPAIRKTGRYQIGQPAPVPPPSPAEEIWAILKAEAQAISAMKGQVAGHDQRLEMAEAEAKALREELAKAQATAQQALDTVSGETHFRSLAAWASRRGVHLARREAGYESRCHVAPLCRKMDLARKQIGSERDDVIWAYPVQVLEAWLVNYVARHQWLEIGPDGMARPRRHRPDQPPTLLP